MNKTGPMRQSKFGTPALPSPKFLQRQCACGNRTMIGGQCAECAKKKSALQRKLAIGASNDPLEQEADRIADQVMTAPTHSAIERAPLQIQRFAGAQSEEADTAPESVDRVLTCSGRPLEPTIRQDMERRFEHDFSHVRVHANAAADESARDVSAQAYTVGHNIVFGAGQFAPTTPAGQRLLAHELTHVVQQSTSAKNAASLTAPASLQRAPSPGGGSAKGAPVPHITDVLVNQNTSQRVTATFSDGHTESDECSTGKGHCCVDDTAGTAEGGACSAARSVQVGNNCTPIGTFTVTAKVPVTSGGVKLWTQFHDAKSVALHEYTPVDGTPLSHGCVRMHTKMAKTIFDGARIGVTRVKVEGLARPRCSDAALQAEWSGDFTSAGSTPPDGSVIDPWLGRRPTRAEIAQERQHINESRKELRSGLGVDDTGLDAEIAAIKGGATVLSKIPRCVPALTNEEKQVPAAQASGFLQAGAATAAKAFATALSRVRAEAAAVNAVKQAGEKLWQAATASASGGGSGTDDRQLYWTREMMTTALRQWDPPWAASADVLRRLHARLLLLFEQTSRGMTTSDFAKDQPDVKRILISGFDPFGFPNAGDIRQSNVSGAAALALDGQTLVQGTKTAHVESVVFPVRYADFNEGIVESYLRPHLTGALPPHLVMSISQGGSQFELEESAGRRRSTDTFKDNLGVLSGGSPSKPVEPPGLAKGTEFLGQSVPAPMLGAMRGALGRKGAIPAETSVLDLPAGATKPRSLPGGPVAGSSQAVEGSGGGFLSNEIFYRNSLVRTQTGVNVPMIHLHTPMLAPGAADATRNALIASVRKTLEATLPHL
jgi:Domain of unknown function (DUF4157)/L,D-transpeptidase catalytic domain